MFFLIHFIGFFFTESKGEGERVGNIDERETSIGCLPHTSYWGWDCSQGACPWPESSLWPLSPQALSTEPNWSGKVWIILSLILLDQIRNSELSKNLNNIQLSKAHSPVMKKKKKNDRPPFPCLALLQIPPLKVFHCFLAGGILRNWNLEKPFIVG